MKSVQMVMSSKAIDGLVDKLNEMRANNQKVIQMKGKDNQLVIIHEKNEKLQKKE